MCYKKIIFRSFEAFKYWYLRALALVLLSTLINSCEDSNTVDTLDGTWWCKEYDLDNPNTDGSPSYNYYVDIAQDYQDSTLYTINNFNGTGIEVSVYLHSLTLTIPHQQIDTYDVEGSGNVKSDYSEINLNYSVDDGSGVAVNYSAKYTKK